MNKLKRIEELEAQVEHLQERIDNLRDVLYEQPKQGDYYWTKFEDLLAWSLKFDPNSNEYQKVCSAGWKMLDLYLKWVLLHAFGGEE